MSDGENCVLKTMIALEIILRYNDLVLILRVNKHVSTINICNRTEGVYMNGQNRADIQVGILVDIVLKKDQRAGALTRGHVKRILTKSANHPHGIKVMLEEGDQVGRVKTIVS
jgi:uncharacterized repeat protein (TIGR03833 family)